MGILYKSDSISALIYILSGSKGKPLCNSGNSLGHLESTLRTRLFDLLPAYLFKLNDL